MYIHYDVVVVVVVEKVSPYCSSSTSCCKWHSGLEEEGEEEDEVAAAKKRGKEKTNNFFAHLPASISLSYLLIYFLYCSCLSQAVRALLSLSYAGNKYYASSSSSSSVVVAVASAPFSVINYELIATYTSASTFFSFSMFIFSCSRHSERVE
jgi:hypothetical protein